LLNFEGSLQYHQYPCSQLEYSLSYGLVMPFIHNFLPHALIYHYWLPKFSNHCVVLREFYYYINHRLQLMLLISLQLSVFFIHIFILDVISKFLFPFINFISLYNWNKLMLINMQNYFHLKNFIKPYQMFFASP
jgi:hypothetical protein